MRLSSARVLFSALGIGLAAGVAVMQILSSAGVTSVPLRIFAAYLICVGASLVVMSIAQRNAAPKERRTGPMGVRPGNHPRDLADRDP